MKVREIMAVKELSKEKKPFYGKNVLLAEDHRTNRELFATLLGWYGFSVDQAENGKTAVEKVKKAPRGTYDIVLMDIGMPVLDGFCAAKMIRKMETGQESRLPIVAVSGYLMEGEIKRALDAGMDACLSKPVDGGEMIRIFEKLLSRQEGHKAQDFLNRSLGKC